MKDLELLDIKKLSDRFPCWSVPQISLLYMMIIMVKYNSHSMGIAHDNKPV